MALRINQNTAAINAHRNLTMTDASMTKSIERLSTGFRVNRASDDPAGLIISEKLRAQISGIGQAVQNSQDGVNVVRTAEAALTEVHSILRSMRDLAVHASNTGASDTTMRTADQEQIQSAISTLNRIADSTQFGTRFLLNGTSGFNATIARPDVVDNVAVSNDAPLGYMDIDVNTVGTKASVTLAAGTAYADQTSTVNNAGDIIINGITVSVKADDTVKDVIDKINASDSGVEASWDSTATEVVLTQRQYGAYNTIDYTESADIFNNVLTANATGVDSVVSISYDGGTSTETMQCAGLVAKGTKGITITLDPANATTGVIDNAFYVKNDSMNFQIGAFAGQYTSVSISSTQANSLGLSAQGLKNKAWTVADIDVRTFTGAQDALQVLDAAIAEVSKRRSDLGSFQKNVLESNISSLSITKENIAASESSIRDTDMAAEMVSFTKNQILMQAGTSMLTQANQLPQNLLSLLR